MNWLFGTSTEEIAGARHRPQVLAVENQKSVSQAEPRCSGDTDLSFPLSSSSVSQDHGQLPGPVGAALSQHRGQHLSAECLHLLVSGCSALCFPSSAKHGGECRQGKASSFMLSRWKVRMYYYGATGWNNIPASYSNFIFEIVLRLSHRVTQRSEDAGSRAAVFRAGTTTLTMISLRKDTVGAAVSLCLVLCVSLQIPFLKQLLLKCNTRKTKKQ